MKSANHLTHFAACCLLFVKVTSMLSRVSLVGHMYGIVFVFLFGGGAYFLSGTGYSIVPAIALAFAACLVPPFIFGLMAGRLPDAIWRVIKVPGSVLSSILTLVVLG